ncbi:MAG: hypothetical protein HUU11_11055 [Anaerolineales bacterium]|nr:hypothetical protein [Anaerolineales bacterium]
MNTNKSQRGQALILIAFGIVALVGFTALAVDGGRVFSDRRHAQNAADTSALAAALSYIREYTDTYATTYASTGNETQAKSAAETAAKSQAVSAGLDRASSNQYQTDSDSTVTVEFCDEVAGTDPCKDLPPGAKPKEYIRVTIVSDVPMTFARVLGRPFVTNRVEAVTRVVIPDSPPGPPMGAGLVAVNHDPINKCLIMNGTANIYMHGSGVSVHCTGAEALFLNGNLNLILDEDAQVSGCTNYPAPGPTVTGDINCNVVQDTLDESDFAHYPTDQPPPVCTTPRTQSNPMQPGYYNSPVTISSTTTFAPGDYCFNADFSIIGGSSISGTGTVKMVLSRNLSLPNGSVNTFDGLEIYVANSNFTVKGVLNTNRLRFFASGTGNFSVNNGTLTSDDAYLYSARGNFDFGSTSVINITAPLTGDFAGILIHKPWDNTTPFTLEGTPNTDFTGLILMPHSDVTINGSSGFELHGQVIGYTIKVNGDGNLDIYYESTVPPGSPPDPTIEFTK